MSYYIFAPQRSGTNYLQMLLHHNFAGARMLNQDRFAWKHSINTPPESQYNRNHFTIVMSKNPYTWVESVGFRNFADWPIRQRTYPVGDPCEPEYRVGKQNFNMISLVKTYKHFYGTWKIRKPPLNGVFVRYEDLLEEQKRNTILALIGGKAGWPRAREEWINPQAGTIDQSRDYNKDREDYYKKLQPKFLTQVQIAKINEVLGEEMFSTLGYTMIGEEDGN